MGRLTPDRAGRMDFNPAIIPVWVLAFLMAVVFHEWAHGMVARRLGDDTASSMGRLTLNPLAHIDPIGTIALPVVMLLTGAPFLFGWAKPVPVAFGRLRNPRRDMVLVALAGPAMNLVLAFASAAVLTLLLRMPGGEGAATGLQVAEPLRLLCQKSIGLNVVLAVFNLIPIPPLDGGRVAVGLLPRELAYRLAGLEPWGFFIIMALLATHVLDHLIGPVASLVFGVIAAIFG